MVRSAGPNGPTTRTDDRTNDETESTESSDGSSSSSSTDGSSSGTPEMPARGGDPRDPSSGAKFTDDGSDSDSSNGTSSNDSGVPADGPNDGRGHEAPGSSGGSSSTPDSGTDDSRTGSSATGGDDAGSSTGDSGSDSRSDGPHDGRGHEAPGAVGGGSSGTGGSSSSETDVPADGPNDGRGHEAPGAGGDSSDSTASGESREQPRGKEVVVTDSPGDSRNAISQERLEQIDDRLAIEVGEDDVRMVDGDLVLSRDARERAAEEMQEFRAGVAAATSGSGDAGQRLDARDFFPEQFDKAEAQFEEQNPNLEAGEDVRIKLNDKGEFVAEPTEEYQAEQRQEQLEQQDRRSEAAGRIIEKQGGDLEKAEVETGRDLDQDGDVTSPGDYLAGKLQESTPYDLERGEDFRVVKEQSEDGQRVSVEMTDQGLATVEQQIEDENPGVDVEVTQDDGIQVERQENFGDIDWSPFVEGDPVENTVDSATESVSNTIQSSVNKWTRAGGPSAFLYASSPAALVTDTTQGTNLVNENSQATVQQMGQTSAELANLPGIVSGGMETVEAAGYAAGGVDNAAALGQAGVAIGEDAAEWAAENPNRAAGGALALAGSVVVGSVAETAAFRRVSSVTGRSVPTAGRLASMSYDQFKDVGSRARSASGSAGRRVTNAVDQARARTPSVRLEKNSDTGVLTIDESASAQLRDEARVSQRQLRDAQDRARQRASSELPALEDVRDRASGARDRVEGATPDRDQLPSRSDLPGRDDLPSRGDVTDRVTDAGRAAYERPAAGASELSRRIRREAVSARFKVAEMARQERQASLRERAKVRARQELTNAQFALSETIDGIERPNVREGLPSREQAVTMASQTFDDVVRRGRMEAKNLEFRAAGVTRGARSTVQASQQRVSQAGTRIADAGRRLASEAQDLDEYGVRITASDEYLDARDRTPRAEFGSEDLVDNVEETGSAIDPVGQLEDIEADTAAANAADDALQADDSVNANTAFQNDRSNTGQSAQSRSRADSQDAVLLKRERGPLARDTFDQQRSGQVRSPGLEGATVASSMLATNSSSVLEEAQTGALPAVDASGMEQAQGRLEAAQRMQALANDGVGQYGVEALAMDDAVDTRMDVGLRVNVGMNLDQDLRLDQNTRIDTPLRQRGTPEPVPPRTPGSPDYDFKPDSRSPLGGPAEQSVSEIEFVNAVAGSSQAFFGGFDAFANAGNDGGFEGMGSGGLEDVDVAGGEF